VEWQWWGKTEVLGGICCPELLSKTHIPHGLKWDWTPASVPKGQLLLVCGWPAACVGTRIVQLHSVWHYAPRAELPALHWSGNTTPEQLSHSGFEVLFRKCRKNVLYELLVRQSTCDLVQGRTAYWITTKSDKSLADKALQQPRVSWKSAWGQSYFFESVTEVQSVLWVRWLRRLP
jgi:hypothetical protein